MYEADSTRKPTSEHADIMLTMPAQFILGRCSDELVYENARVFAETMSGSHVHLLKAVPAISGRSACRCRRRPGESIKCRPPYAVAANQWLMAGLERLLWPVKARPGDNWLGMVRTDGIAVRVAVGIGPGNRYKL